MKKDFQAIVFMTSFSIFLAGCSSSSQPVESLILDAAAKNSSAFVLPQELSPSGVWQELIIVCPYGDAPAQAKEVFHDAVKSIDTTDTDTSQWLLMKDAETVTTVTISRNSLDFCAHSDALNKTFLPNDLWASKSTDEITILTPAPTTKT
ncbi:hypothetical protein [Timonella sp. A28]|uniref:hypothetical protein n=1 Tax=Timonella sp. A28 TaxID=3442640 RepID=UPI003EB849C4